MMKDIEAGHVDCVIVKDLSRLGRDYIEAGRLIQKTFPAFSVRFIALTDHFDSLTADYNETSLVVPVKNFVNDSYSRDISGKVRSHQSKRENGDLSVHLQFMVIRKVWITEIFLSLTTTQQTL